MISKLLKQTELFYYTLIGGVATIIDWTIFAIVVNGFNFHYQFALVLSSLTAGIFHYTANKSVTFGCTSNKLASQLSLYVFVAIISLCCNMAVMATLVAFIPANKIILRMVTTVVMLLPNYLLHKNITFNKYLFAPAIKSSE